MSNLIPSNNNQQSLYLQSVEKQQDALALRKKLAQEHGLTSIGEFIEWWAIVYKDKRYRIMNEQGEYMRDPMIKNLVHKRIDTSGPWRIWFSYKEGEVNGNGDFIQKEEDNTDIIQSKNRIFSAKDGIIIVVDDRSYSPWSRLYTTEWERIPIAEGRIFKRLAVVEWGYSDDFWPLSRFMYCNRWGNICCHDRRKNIIQGMIPVDIDHNYNRKNYLFNTNREKKIHNLWYDSYWYNLINPDWNFLKTELGQYYAYSKRVHSQINVSEWLLLCVHSELSASLPREKSEDSEREFVLYAINKDGKVFRDEFGNTVFSTKPSRINDFDAQWYALLHVDERIFSISEVNCNQDEKSYMCLIHTSWKYLRDGNNTIMTNHKDWGLSEYLDKYRLRSTNTYKRQEDIDRWDTEEKIYRALSDDLIIYWHGTKIDHGSPYREHLNSYDWQAKIINTKINHKSVKFPNGKDWFNHHFDSKFEQFGQSYIFNGNDVDPKWNRTYECVKINWLVARYNKDEEGKELQWVWDIIKSVDDKYLFIQRNEREDYFILDKQFQYIKDKNGEKLSFPHRPPFYVDGMFLYYDTIDWEPVSRGLSKEMYLKEAYFEDGTLVGDNDNQAPQVIDNTQQNIMKSLK